MRNELPKYSPNEFMAVEQTNTKNHPQNRSWNFGLPLGWGISREGNARLSATQPMTILAAATLAGVTLDHWFSIQPEIWLSFFVLKLVGWGVVRWRIQRRPELASRCQWLSVMLVCCVLACAIGLRHTSCLVTYHSASIFDVITDVDEPTIAVGVIDEAVRLRRDPLDEAAPWLDPTESVKDAKATSVKNEGRYQTFIPIKLQTLRRATEDVPFTGRVMARVNGDRSELRPGDRIRVYGRIAAMPPPSNPGQRDQRSWAIRHRIHATLQAKRPRDVELLDALPGSSSTYRWVQRRVADVAASARESVLNTVSPEQHGIALALVLGQRDLLDHATSESLIVTGTAHLLSVSGLHLGILFIVARLIAGLMRLPLGGQLIFLAMVTIFYVAITGGRPPVLRAAILLATFMWSIAIARPYHPLNSLSFALILLLWLMPLEIFSIGMQLSFLAVATLLSCGRPNRKGLTAANEAVHLEESFDRLAERSRSRPYRIARHIGSATFTAIWYSGCVTVVTLPLVWHQFHVVSPVSVFVNVVLSPMMMVALSAGVATVIAGWMFAPMAVVPGWLCSMMLSLMTSVIEWTSQLSWGHYWLPSPPLSWVAAYYVGLVALLMFRSRHTRRMPIGVWSTAWIMIAWWLATTPAPLPKSTFETTFIDVGHGTAAVLRPSRDEVWLYDCGWLGNFGNRSHKIDEVLWSMGVTNIDGLILSHADSDHFNALPGLAQRFQIGQVIIPPEMFEGDGRSLSRARQAVQQSNLSVTELNADSPIPLQSLSSWWEEVSVLHPPRERIDGNDNANSLVLQINHGGRSLVLPGDLEPPGTSVLISRPRPQPGGVMMAPHHGSLRMDADAVLQWARPTQTVVSGGDRAGKVEVTEMLSATGGGVHVTSKVGCVRVRINETGEIEIRSWKLNPW